MTNGNPSPIRVAVVGAGHLGRFHAKLAAASDRFDLVAVADPANSAAERVAAEASTRAVADYRGLLGRIDAAVVATPTVTHHAIASELLGSGVHCLVEKPLAPNSNEADALVSLAQQKGLVLQVGHVERFNPALQLAGPVLDDPKYISATRTSGYTFRSTDIGAVLDIMIHDIDLVLGLAKSPVAEVSAIGVSVMGGHEDLATAHLTFESGCVAQLTASRVSYELQRTMQVFSPRGFASMDFASRQTTVVEPSASVLRGGFNAETLSAEQRDSLKTGLFEELLVKKTSDAPAVNAIELEQGEFADAVITGATPRVTGAVGSAAVSVAERVLEKISEHRWNHAAGASTPPVGMPSLPIGPFVPGATPPQRKAG